MFGMATADAVEDSGFPGGIPFLIGLLFFGSAPLLFAVGRLQVGWIAFSDRGIHQRGWSFESFVPWTSVLGADAVFPGYPATSVTVLFRDDSEWRRRNTAGFLKIDPLPPGPGIRIDHRKMRDDPVLVNEFVVREVERRRQFRFGPAGTVPSAAAIPVSPATWPDTGRPAEWPRRGWRTTRDYVKVTLSMLMFAAVAGVCVAGAVVDLRDGGTASVKYFVAAAAVCVSICSFPFVLRPWSNGELTTESCELDGQPATRIRYSARPPIALCLLFGTFVLIFGMAAIDSAEDSGLPGALPFATAALFFASLPLSFLVGRLQVGWIAFSDRGIHQRGWSFESFVPWTDVVNAHALFPGYPMTMITVLERDGTGWQRRNTAWFWKIDRLPPTAMIEIDHRKMRDDPVLVHDFIVREVEAKQQSRRWRR
ncbi:hypothetical protein [Rhodococcus rhodnii]|nr:hypothetical protein [Rhodococcus rhodnii]